ncbi:MAG: hypothetical protein E3J64_03290, partial [Anaerolineales bacterium]
MEKVSYKGWKNCYRLSNDVIDLVVTTDVGPRIIRLGFVDDENELKEYKDQLGATGGDEWRIYGGHRLWHAPESKPRTYAPDNAPVRIEDLGGPVRLTQDTEPSTGIQKEIDVRLDPSGAHATLTHRLRNNNLWPVELAPWSLTVMTTGGKAIMPLPPRGSHEENLLPASLAALWAYTDMTDPRWTWGQRYVMLQQDPKAKSPQKVGLSIPLGWAAYARGGHLFVKTFDYVAGAPYPDLGCNFEAFTNADMLEVETLGPPTSLLPGAA